MADTATLPAVNIDTLRREMISCQKYLARSASALREEHSGFVPKEGMWNAAQQVAHIVWSIDWFRDGVLRPDGFDMDFEEATREHAKVISLEAARARLDETFDRLLALLDEKPAEFWMDPLPEGPVLGGQPKMAIFSAIADHTAHHRGALTVYARLLGLEPPMPYA